MSRPGEFWRFLRSTPPAANLFALATLALWLVKSLYFDHLPPLFPGAHELGKIVEGILSAIIAGWVFYLFFALLPEARQRRFIEPFLLAKVATIAGDAEAVLHEFEKASGDELSFSRVTEAELLAAFSKVPTQSQTSAMVGTVGHFASWFEYFRHRRERTRNSISEVFGQSRYVEPELASIILKLSQNSFFMMTESMERLPVRNPHLGVLASEFFKYLDDCRKLAGWHDSHLVPPKGPILPSLD